ncbi:DUF2264 domain-containing protein [Paenibacillus sp. IB182496]|uniref:DUF2264 domain-containing protein n=1 Tax=Paenibacillus sabuli TaxID=2772509 RepID=A0A927GPM6_9BACL|nr:DUF2264 domain-containing protein [Paenibacillus sabuli]MBD2843629.1 DUF2264 domain-containing protein [Paenibacillus sabuli]
MSDERERSYWLQTMLRIGGPVLEAAAHRRLREDMPLEAKRDRSACSYLEAFGRTLCGMAPWLELTDPDLSESEAALQKQYREWAVAGLDALTNPDSPDYGRFGDSPQSLVDAAFLAEALLRAPGRLWEPLEARVKQQVLEAMRATRVVTPPYNNWLLFAAMVETWIGATGEQADGMRIDYALREHELWYKGDGTYGDGPEFHWDYYNSYVIQPMLLDTLRTQGRPVEEQTRILTRAQRYAEVQERLIAPDGSFAPLGRSLAYRCGAFHLLAQLALLDELPQTLPRAQVRCALEAVIRRTMDAPGTFDANGWLRIGLCGHQPGLGEGYISTGSLYLCTAAFLPLGLPAHAPFWQDDDQAWTAQRLWSSEDLAADHALTQH